MPRYQEHPPSPTLAPYVTCFWELESRGQPHRVLPDAAMDVLYALGGSGAEVVGTMTRAIVAGAGEPLSLVGVRFRPGAALELLGVGARELRDFQDLAGVTPVGYARERPMSEIDNRAGDARATVGG